MRTVSSLQRITELDHASRALTSSIPFLSQILGNFTWILDPFILCLVFMCWKEKKVKSLSCVPLFATPWTVAYQAPLSMGFFQSRVLEWVAISFSRGSFQPRDRTQVSLIVGRSFTVWATREADAFMHWASTKNGIHRLFTFLVCSNT